MKGVAGSESGMMGGQFEFSTGIQLLPHTGLESKGRCGVSSAHQQRAGMVVLYRVSVKLLSER